MEYKRSFAPLRMTGLSGIKKGIGWITEALRASVIHPIPYPIDTCGVILSGAKELKKQTENQCQSTAIYRHTLLHYI